MADPAREKFESFLKRGALSRIERCLHRDEIEDEWLDYKANRRRNGGVSVAELTEDTLKVFAKAASAFANSSGGVIVWGIDDPEQGKPRSKVPLPDAQRFRSLLVEHQATVLDPHLVGIDHQGIKERGSKAGYVVSYVPKGPLVHMAKAGLYTFFLRSGSNSVRMPTEMVRALMHHRSLPTAKLVARDFSVSLGDKPILVAGRNYARAMRHLTEARIKFGLHLENTGASLLESVGIVTDGGDGWRVQFNTNAFGGEEVHFTGYPHKTTLYTFMEDRPIYPGVVTQVAKVDRTHQAWSGLVDFRLRYTVVGRNDLSSVGELVIGREQMRQVLVNGLKENAQGLVIYDGDGFAGDGTQIDQE